jgi:hypothetical protein
MGLASDAGCMIVETAAAPPRVPARSRAGVRRSAIHPLNVLLLLPAIFWFTVRPQIDFLPLEGVLIVLSVGAATISGKRLNWTPEPPAWCAVLRDISRNGLLSFFLPALASIGLRAAMLPWVPIPDPVVPDEFSHILLAKTFLLGRLTNPAHPLWQHFESIHILSQPTYSSMYMAGQACFLALGQLLFGNLFWGVVLSTALLCGTLTWFFRAYVPPGWALFGGMLAAVRIGGASYWNNSYWGGSAGALGGAMVLGAYPRLSKTWKPIPALIFAAGLVLLANTRPYEGAILGLSVSLLLARDLLRAKRLPWKRIGAAVAIAAIVLGIFGWAMTRQWKAVTGHALTLPYQVNQKMYGWPMTVPWIKIPSVTYRHPEFALYHDFEVGEHRGISELSQVPMGLLLKYASWWRFLFGIALCPVMFYTSRILVSIRTRAVWMAAAPVAIAVLTEQSGYPHYWAPILPAMLLFIVEGLRRIVHWQPSGRPVGPAIVRFAIPVFCVVLVARAAAMSPSSAPPRFPNFFSWCCTDARINDREPLVHQLESIPGKHLVIVSYELKSYQTLEWVYNEPDIDHSRIVFARDMGPEKNEELIRYYSDRRVWRVVVRKDQVASLTPVTR